MTGDKTDPYDLDPTKLSTVPFHEFRCPFCDVVLEKKEMQFHVGYPLCKTLALKQDRTVEMDHPFAGFRTQVREIKMEYHGQAGMRKLLAYMWDRSTFNHPDKGKPIPLEEFIDHSED